MPVAIPTFSDSLFSWLVEKDGIKSLSETHFSISELIPFPSFPIITNPLFNSFFV